MSAHSVAASYKPPMLVTWVRLPACACFSGSTRAKIRKTCSGRYMMTPTQIVHPPSACSVTATCIPLLCELGLTQDMSVFLLDSSACFSIRRFVSLLRTSSRFPALACLKITRCVIALDSTTFHSMYGADFLMIGG